MMKKRVTIFALFLSILLGFGSVAQNVYADPGAETQLILESPEQTAAPEEGAPVEGASEQAAPEETGESSVKEASPEQEAAPEEQADENAQTEASPSTEEAVEEAPVLPELQLEMQESARQMATAPEQGVEAEQELVAEDEEQQLLEAGATSMVAMYRLYNPNSSEHFYTASSGECNHLVFLGWKYEGIGWIAPKTSKTPVYRLYNANAGDHHYTSSDAERKYLIKVGWRDEGIGWYSDDGNAEPLYRQYNPNAKAGSHNYTTSKGENDYLVKVGWRAEGIGWYGCNSSTTQAKNAIKEAEKAIVADPARTVYLKTTNGKRTLKNYLQNAMVPVGRTLYIWGGGWGSDRHKIGYLRSWETFFKSNKTADYDYKDHRYEYGNGLDCSGYVAWVLYNTMYSKDGIGDLSLPWGSTVAAKRTIEKGFATDTTGQKFYPGDVVSMTSRHVWISLGQYKDGSILLVHSSPKGVQISGTKGTAATRANYYMKKYFKAWPYATRTVGESYYRTDLIQKATWKVSGGVFTDPDGVQKMSAEQVTKLLFGE